ncbi:glycosyltransferase family 2 protein [Oceanimonas smirnovii]|uniref:Glycosyltransferase family 2 protein n=1 Tax=Oceanimonas smirnovii TaxID=264574 RepID=A0ABW7P4F1_9GAMM
MKQLVRSLVRNSKTKPKIEGYIELFTHDYFEGWAIHKEQQPISIDIELKGERFSVSPQWLQRDDVMAIHGQDFRNAGFSAQWPDKIKNILKTETITKNEIMIKANNTTLTITGVLPEASPLEQAPLLKSKPAVTGLGNAVIENFNHFSIRGYFLSESASTPKLIISSSNELQNWPVLWQSETVTLEEGLATETHKHSFEIEVPGYAWEAALQKEQQEINIQLSAEKFDFFESIILTQEKSAQWLHQISLLNEDNKLQYYGLIAIEHLRFSGLQKALDPRTKAFYQNFADKMQLTDFLNTDNKESGTLELKIENSIPFETQQLWQAQKNLNKKLIGQPEEVYSSVMSVHNELKLIGNIKKSFLQSVVPLLAKKNQLLQLKQLIDFKEFYSLDHSENAWEVSLAIAPLVADKQIKRATDALWRLAKMLDKGWLNTECIWFAVNHIQMLEEHGELGQSDAEKARYAVISILDGFHGEWFSRLHDTMLQQTAVDMLARLHLMSDYQQRDVIKVTIRHYGLSPDFWNKVIQAGLDNLADSLFQRAHRYWLQVEQAFLSIDQLPAQWRSVAQALDFYERQGNHEAAYIRREMITALLHDPNTNQDELLELLEKAIADDPMEAVRYAAHPMLQDNTAQHLLETYRHEIPEALRLNTERGSSVTYQAQVTAAQQLRDGQLDTNALVALNNWPAMFLSIDMLVTKMVNEPASIDDHLHLLDYYLQQVIALNSDAFWLPAPVCTALANLNQLASSHAPLRSLLLQIQSLITNKYGDLHNSLFAQDKAASPAATQLTAAGWPQDTLVVIYSCRAYLDSRIKAIRETWLKDLQERNIPYVIMVGDGEDKLNGDVLELNVSDTYEDLPHKSLKLFDWVYHNTNAQYVLKIDDDCYLDVDKYFGTLAYRKHHYYGRVIHRPVGGMDRAWHHSKSKTERARKAIDKSPEPALYADGGGGYTLSRIAMQNLLEAATSIRGKRLIINSFMEDKLVGDLLAINHIRPSNEDYECYQRRRTFGAASPVGMWENIFFPSRLTPTQVTHLDTDKVQAQVSKYNKQDQLWPKKLWQSCWPVNIHLNSNQLELMTEQKKAFTLLQQELFVIAAMRNEMIMLPHFLAHYRKLGVKAFIITDNCSDDGTREYLLEQSDVLLYSADTEYKHSQYGVAWQQAMLANHCTGKWALIADADELLVYPGHENKTLIDYVSEVEAEGYDCIRTDMIDMYPLGDLSEADFTKNAPFEVANWHDKEPLKEWALGSGWFSNSKNWASSLRHRIDNNAEPNAFVSQKYALIKYKPWMRFSQGIHYAAGINAANTAIQFCHFKYHAGFKAKVEEEIKRKQHYDGAKEYQRYLAMMAEAKGKFADKTFSTTYKYKV